jgi:hypothetical protein
VYFIPKYLYHDINCFIYQDGEITQKGYLKRREKILSLLQEEHEDRSNSLHSEGGVSPDTSNDARSIVTGSGSIQNQVCIFFLLRLCIKERH